MYCTTPILDHIITLSEAELQLLGKGDYLTDDEQQQFRAIRAALAKLWTKRRAELAFARRGPPRIVGTYGANDRARIHAVALLPNGGD
jgi:hypothetical protein